jgi:hypothetical protein
MNQEIDSRKDERNEQRRWDAISSWEPPLKVDWPEGLSPEQIARLEARHADLRRRWKDRNRSGPSLTALESVLERWNTRISSDVARRLEAEAARLAQRHRAGVWWLSWLRNDELTTFVSQSPAHRQQEPVRRNGPGIVPHVARTLLGYATPDVAEDPYNTDLVSGVQSEQTAPIVVEDEQGGASLLGVVNHQSFAPAEYHAASAELLRQETQELTRFLVALNQLGLRPEGGALPCAWNPCRLGWGLRNYLTTLLQEVKQKLQSSDSMEPGRSNLHFTVWYVDQGDQVLSTIATTGFSDGVKARESLEIDDPTLGVLGQLARSADWTIDTWLPNCGVNHVSQALHAAMGTVRSRLIVSPELPSPTGVGPFRLIVQIDCFDANSERLLPGDSELRAFAKRLYEQVQAYLALYPRRAADEIRRTLHDSPTFAEQWHAVAEKIKLALRADAVTLYARPWHDPENLHVIAATAPLVRRDGMSIAALDPESRPVMSLIPAPHTVGDQSYAGTLARRHGVVLCRNSLRHSRRRLTALGFPLDPSDDYREALTRTVIADPRFLGYALPNRKYANQPSIAVALVVRSADRAPFKAWDAAALVSMLEAAAPMVQSWRDWSAPRLPEANGIVWDVHKNVDELFRVVAGSIGANRGGPTELDQLHDSLAQSRQEIFYSLLSSRLSQRDTMPHRLQDPIPRSESLAALTREIAAETHERARVELNGYWPVIQAAVLMEARARGRSVMHSIAYYHQYRNAVPQPGDPQDPRLLRIPEWREDWRRMLDERKARVFRGEPTVDDRVSAGVRIPFQCWVGRNAARAALVLDFRSLDTDFSASFRDDLMLLARKLAAALTVSGSSITHGKFVPQTDPQRFTNRLRTLLRASALELHLGTAPERTRKWTAGDRVGACQPQHQNWLPPSIPFDRAGHSKQITPDQDSQLWGVTELVDSLSVRLRVPLIFGMEPVGHVVAAWWEEPGPAPGAAGSPSQSAWSRFHDDPATTRAVWIRDILAAWSLWSWSWSRPNARDDALVYVDVHEREGAWHSAPKFREREHSAAGSDQRRAREAREVMVAAAGTS